MKHKKSLLSQIIMTTVLPVIFIFLGTVGISMAVISQNPNSVSDSQNRLLLISAIGLCLIICVISLVAKNISKRITRLTVAANQLADGDVEVGLEIETAKDQLSQLAVALFNIAENIKTQSTAVKKIAAGDLSEEIETRSKKDLMGNSLKEIQNSLSKMLVCWINMSEFLKSEGTINGKLYEETGGDYKIATECVAQTIRELAKRNEFYMAVLDAMPYQIAVMDINLKRIFINKTLEETMKSKGSRSTAEMPREAFYGNDCSQWQLQMCNTENCGVAAFKKSGQVVEYPYEFNGEHFRMDTTDIKDKNGKTFGYVEMFLNTTATMSVNHYLKTEIQRLANNLKYLAEGNLEFDVDIQEPNEFTIEVSERFRTIENNLRSVKESISNLIGEATMLTQAVMEGNLDTRAVETQFNGTWKELICGMNRILGEIEKPLDEVAEVMHEIAEGDLNATVNGDYKGSFYDLKNSVNIMGREFKTIIQEISIGITEIGNGNFNLEDIREYKGDFNAISKAINMIIVTLNTLLADINHAAIQVNVGANQVADSSQNLAQGATEQASTIQELTASINEIADQTRRNAVDANNARDLAKDVMENAEKGNSQMLEMQRSMIEINKSSEDISKIIKVIDDIAFQTNILALNAAVEAARAGQHGRGFAVVAEEVRTLAARSAEAARETTDLIEGTICKVREGTRITNETAGALDEIVGGISKVNALFGNIAEASNEQATGIAQINSGVEQVANVVQQNSATAEESAAASEELSSQSVLLKEMIHQFKLR